MAGSIFAENREDCESCVDARCKFVSELSGKKFYSTVSVVVIRAYQSGNLITRLKTFSIILLQKLCSKTRLKKQSNHPHRDIFMREC